MTILYKYKNVCLYFVKGQTAVYWKENCKAAVAFSCLIHSRNNIVVGTLSISEEIKRLREVVESFRNFAGGCCKHLNYLEAKFKTIQLFYKRRYHTRKSAAIFIQYLWKRSYYCPQYKMCQKRIQNWK